MLELISLIFLLLIFLAALVINPGVAQRLDGVLLIDQSAWMAAILVFGFALMLLVVGVLINRFLPALAAQIALGSESLAWQGHVVLPLAILGIAGYLLIAQHPIRATLVAAMLTSGIITLANFVRQQWAIRKPAHTVGPVKSTPSARSLRISWNLPIDPRFAEVRVLRTEGSEGVPEHAWLRPAIYEGVLDRFEDHSVEAGRPYYYTVFTISGRGYSSAGIPSQPTRTTPRPQPVQKLKADSQHNDAILLRWFRPLDYNIACISIQRSSLTPDGKDLRLEIDAEADEFLDGPLKAGLAFEYTVTMINEEGQSSDPVTDRASTRVPAPELKTETVERNHVYLTWTLPPIDLPAQYVLIHRRQEDDPEKKDKIYDRLGNEFLDKGIDQKGLAYETAYFYDIQVFYSDLVKSDIQTRRHVTGSQVTGLRSDDIVVEANRRTISLNWHIPQQADLAGLHISRKWEDLISGKQKEKVWDEELTERFTDTDVEPVVQYFYTIQLRTRDGQLSASAKAIAELLPPPRQVEQATAERCSDPADAVMLHWHLPRDPSIAGIRIVRRYDRIPRTRDDGDIIFDAAGQATTCTDQHVGAGEPIYAIFTYAQDGVASDPTIVRTQQPFRVTVMLEGFPDLIREISNRNAPVRKVAKHMLKQAGVVLAEVDDWMVRVVETNEELAGDSMLSDLAVCTGQTLMVSFTRISVDAVADQGEEEHSAPDPTDGSIAAQPETQTAE